MKPNPLTLVIAVLIVAAGAYWYFFADTGNEAPLSAATAQNESQAQFQTLVVELKPISFTTNIFEDPRFRSLVDLATPVTPETAGRLDPFAPTSAAQALPHGGTATSTGGTTKR